MSAIERKITPADILPDAEYARRRDDLRKTIIAEKKNRRVEVGPFATFYFESYETMWLQVMEMLRIEKGGAEQLKDELQAYNPLIPQGRELVATVMFEIDDPARRATFLATLGGVENHMELRMGGQAIKGKAERDLDYTSAEGKASSVQFVHFPFTAEQIVKFRAPVAEIAVAITHPSYSHMAIMPQPVKESLAKDFS